MISGTKRMKRFLSTVGTVSVLVAGLMVTSVPAAHAQYNPFKDPSTGSDNKGNVSGPNLSATESQIDGGRLTVGVTSYIVTVFRNDGTAPVKVGNINLYPSSTVGADVSLNQCKDGMVPPGAECAITVAVSGLQEGAWRVELLVDHNGRTRLATASIAGQVDGTADDRTTQTDLEPSTDELDFGESPGGVPSVKSVVFKNRTSQPIDILNIGIDTPPQSGFSIRTGCPKTIQPGSSCNVAVTWSPISAGPAQGIIIVEHSGKSGLTQVEVSGTFVPEVTNAAAIYPPAVPSKGLLISDREQFDFGSDIEGSVAMTASLVNTGSEPLTLTNVRLSGSNSGVSIARSGCRPGTVLQPIEACALTVNWVPSRSGSIVDDIQIHHTGARGILILPVRGTSENAVSRDSLAVRQNTVFDENGEVISVAPTPVLDGYVVTSHSSTRAVINGPVGSQIVRDGEDVVLSGVKWVVTIVRSGVILTTDSDEILLVFDRSLKPTTTTETSDTNTGEDTSENDTETDNSDGE